MLSGFDIIKKKRNKIPGVFQGTQMEISEPRTQKYLQLKKKTILVHNLLFPNKNFSAASILLKSIFKRLFRVVSKTKRSKTRHPKLENEDPKSRKRSTLDRKRSTQKLETGLSFINTRPMLIQQESSTITNSPVPLHRA